MDFSLWNLKFVIVFFRLFLLDEILLWSAWNLDSRIVFCDLWFDKIILVVFSRNRFYRVFFYFLFRECNVLRVECFDDGGIWNFGNGI